MKKKIVDVLLITLVFTACVVKVAPISGQSEKNEEKIEENATENKRGISSVIEETLEVNDISGKTKHIEEKVKESLIEAEMRLIWQTSLCYNSLLSAWHHGLI